MIKAILIDDEENSISSLKEKLLAHCTQVKIIACCNNAAKGIEAIDSLQPDIVFLDIEMPVMNGFVMLQQLKYKNFELIFTTAYDHYAIKAIRYSALDYLVKPIEIEDLKTAVLKAEEKRNHSYPNPQIELLVEQLINKKNSFNRIAIPTIEGLHFIKVEDIIYLEASSNYTHIFTTEKKKYIASHTLKDFEDMLPPEIFLRIHNSYIINKNFTEKYIRGEGGELVMIDGKHIPVSREHKKELLERL